VAKQVAERLNSAIRLNPESAGSKIVNMTICSGTASTDIFPAASADELIAHANGALMSAQKMGHNSISQAMG
ncbi:MAG: hypothetical protein VB032_04240, partial [Burkholderiaceae bacterium]|nr:hypothetical protein [Burkholderiaceae bacterium]